MNHCEKSVASSSKSKGAKPRYIIVHEYSGKQSMQDAFQGVEKAAGTWYTLGIVSLFI
ncbi:MULTISPECIES: hypothetical protein [Acutalibacteraceae]|uniref:hypothetical protein n=1 Tax=Acutalibacteraceae TaxID=3082771 RepID=UPI0013E8E490|nr:MULTISPECIES: hypothetical protein [Acutalibacteraceae]